MNSINYPVSKADLRRSLLKTRQSMPVEQWQDKSDRICTHLQSSALLTQAKTILAYFSFRQEPDLGLLLNDNKHQWGIPRCVDDSLIWHRSKPGDVLQIGSYGILEPLPSAPTLQSEEVDMLLVPAVACDYQGYRLGYGGGYYDRLLSASEWKSKLTIGIIFNFAYLPQLPIDPWDKPLQAVCTETGLHWLKS